MLDNYLTESRAALSRMIDLGLEAEMEAAVELTLGVLRKSQPLLICGNGGSASDAMHIAGELVGRFLKERRAINCICLAANPAVLTAWANDYDYDSVFSRQVEAFGRQGGLLMGISTSGNSVNVVRAFEVARALNIPTIALTGQGGGRLKELSDVLIAAPSTRTPIIQQLHICLYHYFCERLEQEMSRDAAPAN